MDCSPPGFSVHEIFQARILERVAISFSKGSSQARDQTHVSCTAGRFSTDWTTRETQGKAYFWVRGSLVGCLASEICHHVGFRMAGPVCACMCVCVHLSMHDLGTHSSVFQEVITLRVVQALRWCLGVIATLDIGPRCVLPPQSPGSVMDSLTVRGEDWIVALRL